MRERLRSLDLLRGVTVAGMILVNNAGDYGKVYAQLDHAEWHGLTATDLVFPFFLFMVGVSIHLALAGKTLERRTVLGVARRGATLFALGVFLNAFPFTLERPLRVLGVLQRIGLCYTAVALVALVASDRALRVLTGALLAGSAAALLLVPVPGFGPGALDVKGQDVGAWIDRAVLAGHLHQRAPAYDLFDPEGLFSTLPSIATTLTGVLAGRWLARTTLPPHERASGLFAAGLGLALLGLAATWGLPLNKNLWTSSYALVTSGLACQALAACLWLVDLQGVARGTGLFVAFGRNPIVAFFVSSALARLLLFGPKLADGSGRAVALKVVLYERFFARGGSTPATSLAFAVAYLGLFGALVTFMDRRKLYVKV